MISQWVVPPMCELLSAAFRGNLSIQSLPTPRYREVQAAQWQHLAKAQMSLAAPAGYQV